jgi:NAD(P)-dependent dehydrogenase (short-subunit alcohol dehydrogenase family)
MSQLAGKKAIVMGGSRSIGAAIVHTFAEDGWPFVIDNGFMA